MNKTRLRHSITHSLRLKRTVPKVPRARSGQGVVGYRRAREDHLERMGVKYIWFFNTITEFWKITVHRPQKENNFQLEFHSQLVLTKYKEKKSIFRNTKTENIHLPFFDVLPQKKGMKQ